MTTTHAPTTRRTRPHALFDALAAFPAGKRTKWIMLGLWIALIAIVSPFAADLASVEQNDTASWLADDAEALQVERLLHAFPQGDTLPAVIVYHRPGGLTAEDRAALDADRQALATEYPDMSLATPVISQSGAAALVVATMANDGEIFFERVPAMRDMLVEREGLEVLVTGPAAYTTDVVNVFDGIDTTLLIASVLVVTVILLGVYRSPFLWLVPLLAVGFAHLAASGAIYWMATNTGVAANSQNTGILPVLVFGVGTDYALLLIARYREELRRHADTHRAMAIALRRVGPAIIASGGTTIVGLLCLLAADLNATRGLGPIAAAGIACALLAMLTLLPAVLVICGRRVFWPFVPQHGSVEPGADTRGVWGAIGRGVAGRTRVVWVGTALVLAIGALGLLRAETYLPADEAFRAQPESVAGQALISEHFSAGASTPALVVARTEGAAGVEAALAAAPQVTDVRADGVTDSYVAYAVTFDVAPGTRAALDAVRDLRERVHAVPGAGGLVGGPTAQELDTVTANERDRWVVIPLVLAVVLVILALLMRALVASLLMVATSILSFTAVLGASMVIFQNVFGFPALDGSILILAFVFLITLGVDYNIFLMTRIREEAATHGTREGTLRGLAATGGVITSAGLVVAATFGVLGVLPLVTMTQLGFIVASGILLETFVVRSILLPALTLELGERTWWPLR
jgi:putative drug exporter of the RND superfamily